MLTEQERNIVRQVKQQGGTREQVIEVLGQHRSRQPKQEFKSLSQEARESLEKTPEQLLGVGEFKEESKELPEDISGFDIGVKAGKGLSEGAREFKTEGVDFPETLGETGKALGITALNLAPDAIEGIGEVIELASDPVGVVGGIKDLALGLVDKASKLGLKLGVGISGGDITQEGIIGERPNEQTVNAVSDMLIDQFGTLDKATKTITENPVDTILVLKSVIQTAAKNTGKGALKDSLEAADKSLPEKLSESAKKDIEQALGATKEKFKQKGRDIAGGVAERKIGGTLEQVNELAAQKASEFGKDIQDFIDSGKLKGTVKRDDLLNVLDDIRKQGQVGDVIIDESIVNATDKMADVISSFGKEIPAEKARVIRKMFDDAVYNTKGVVSEEALSLKNNIKKGLADDIRKQLAEQNPDLAKINKEFNFYKTLEEVSTETLNRKGPQQGGLTGNIAGGGGLAGGAAIFGDVTGAVATAVIAKGLTEAMKSTRWRLLKASTKQRLADALASGDKNKATKVATEVIKTVLQNKANIFIGGQVTESNLELNQ